MKQFVLFEGDVWEVVREDHFGNPDYMLLCLTGKVYDNLRYTHKNKCTPLDPALNILFERKIDG